MFVHTGCHIKYHKWLQRSQIDDDDDIDDDGDDDDGDDDDGGDDDDDDDDVVTSNLLFLAAHLLWSGCLLRGNDLLNYQSAEVDQSLMNQ